MRIFFSFSSRNMSDAAALVTELRKKHDVFFSPDSIGHGAYWQPVLAEELAKADAFVLLVAGDKPGPWQMPEYYTAFDRKVKQPDFPLVPIVAGGASAAFPFLAQINWIMAEGPLGEGTAALIESALVNQTEPVQQPWRHANPFRNLEALDEANADLFFGRETEIRKAVTMLADQPGKLLALVGSSGAGKSSLAMAGITAALRSQHLPGQDAHWPSALQDSRGWLFLKMTPGEKPVDQLAEAFLKTWQLEAGNPAQSGWLDTWTKELLDGQKSVNNLCRESIGRFRALGMEPPSGIFLYIDQGEESYRAGSKQSERFSALIGDALSLPGFRCMMSLRSDHYGFLQADNSVFPVTQVLDVPPLGQDQLAEIVRSAAQALKARFADEGMPEDIAAAATGQPGALPLLSVYLSGMWEAMQRAGDGVLRLPTTTSAIEIASVLREKAERYIRENPDKEEAVRRLFVPRLVRVPKDGPALRRRATLSSLSPDEQAVAAALAGPNHRLLMTSEVNGEAMVEVAHEALFTAWDRLKNWIASRREFLEWKDGFEQARKNWEAEPRKRNLLMGGNLDRAEGRLKSDGDDLDPPDKDFIGASTRANRWRKLLIVTAASFVILLVVFIIIIGSKAYSITSIALKDSLDNESRYLYANANEALKQGDATTSLKIAIEATINKGYFNGILHTKRDLNKSIIDIMQKARAHAAIEQDIDVANDQGFTSATISKNGRYVLTASKDGSATIWDSRHRFKFPKRLPHSSELRSAIFSENGKYVLTSYNNRALVWNMNNLTPVGPDLILEDNTFRISFSKNNKLALASSIGGEIKVARTSDLKKIGKTIKMNETLRRASFSNKGDRILTISDEGSAEIWNSKTGNHIWDSAEIDFSGKFFSFSNSGDYVVGEDESGFIQFFSTSSSMQYGMDIDNESYADDVVFSHDDELIAVIGVDNTINIWRTDTQKQIGKNIEIDSKIKYFTFSPNNSKITAYTENNSVYVWDSFSGIQTCEKISLNSNINSIFFNGDESALFVATDDNTLKLYSILPKIPNLKYLSDSNTLWSGMFTNDNKYRINYIEGGVEIIRVEDNKKVGEKIEYRDIVKTFIISQNEERVAIVGESGDSVVWDLVDGTEIDIDVEVPSELDALALDPENNNIVINYNKLKKQIWDVPETVDQFIARIRRELPSCLTAEERERYGLPPREDIKTNPLYCKEG